VDNRTWSEVNRRYIIDQNLFRRMVENNRFAMQEIMKRLVEAERRGYWEATEEELEALRNRFLELEALIEDEMQGR
jgi:cobaltochelatase CobN